MRATEKWPQTIPKKNSKASLNTLDLFIKSFTVAYDISQYENTGVKADKKSYLPYSVSAWFSLILAVAKFIRKGNRFSDIFAR